uniref:Uncharacterized protein n=1 Tax=viral metagenome TaxID=1070528 RepID=A0A6H1ZYU2_9ZZZZ
MSKETSRPEHTVRCGGIQIAIWLNETSKGIFQSITIDKSYKEGDEWKHTKSFKPNDLVKLQIGINKVLEYLYWKSDVIQPKADTTEF